MVNNNRFLVLPDRQRYPDLASRVLALCLRRLDADWREHWGHPVLMVESFVDESKYRGTCYKACGFEAVGLTSGYGRSSRDYYQEHGRPKQFHLRELRSGAGAILRRGRLPAKLPGWRTAYLDDSQISHFDRLASCASGSNHLGSLGRLAGQSQAGRAPVAGDGCGGCH